MGVRAQLPISYRFSLRADAIVSDASLGAAVVLLSDGHGVLDVVTANLLDGDVTVLLGQGDGSFGVEQRVAAVSSPVALVVADMDVAGALEPVVISSVNLVAILRGAGDGSFFRAEIFSAGSQSLDCVVEDFDRDFLPDVALASFGRRRVTILLNQLLTPSRSDR